MRHFFSLLLVFTLPVAAFAQSESAETGTIQGTVAEQITGAPLAEADVHLLETDEHQTSAEDGTFWFTGVAPGTYTLSVSHSTYRTAQESTIEVRAGDTTLVKMSLGDVFELEKVIIEGERVPPTVSRQEIRGSELLRLPGTGGDALKGLMTLPSIGIPNDFVGSLYIRGSTPGDNLIYFDRTPLGYPFHYGGIVSTISSEIIDDIHIYAGGYGAEFGLDAQTVIDIRSRDKLEDEALSGTFNLNILYSEGLLEGQIGEKGYVYLSGRRSYLDLVVGPFIEGNNVWPYFSDYQFKYAHDLGEKHHLTFNAFGATDHFEFDIVAADADSEAALSNPEGVESSPSSAYFKNGFEAQGVHLRSHFTEELTSHLSLTRSHNFLNVDFDLVTNERFAQGPDGEWEVTYTEYSHYDIQVNVPVYTLREDVSYKITPTLQFEPGFLFAVSPASSFSYTNLPVTEETEVTEGEELGELLEEARADGDEAVIFRNDSDGSDGIFLQETRTEETREEFNKQFRRAEGYLQTRYEPFPFLSAALGVRLDYLNVTDEISVQPRASLAFKMPSGASLRLAYGRYEQSPKPYEMLAEDGNPALTSSVTSHYIVELEQELTSQTELKLAGYYKTQANLVTPDEAAGYLNQGVGYVGGAEMFLRHRITDTFFGWISYAWTHAERRPHPDAEYAPYLFDNMSVVSVVANYNFSPTFEIGAKWQYSSGTSSVPVADIFLVQDQVTRGMRRLPFETEDDDLIALPSYHRLDVRISKKWDFDGWKIGGFLEILNAYNRRNVMQFTNPEDGSVEEVGQFPIIPYIGLTVEF